MKIVVPNEARSQMSNGETVKAQRAMVRIGNLEVEGFMLPDGSYRMSLSQAAECVGLQARNAFDFLRSKTFKQLMGEGYTVSISEIEPDTEQARGASRIRALPLEVVSKYWNWQSHRGNKAAFALVDALILESLERRFDSAFNVDRTETDYNQRLAERMKQLEQTFGDAFAFADEAVSERDYFLRLLQENGIDPYDIPDEEQS